MGRFPQGRAAALILGRIGYFPVQGEGRMLGPARVKKKGSSHADKVGLLVANDGFRLMGAVDHAHRTGKNTGFVFDAFGIGKLVGRSHRNLGR